MITSPHNPTMKLVRTLLGRPKERREAGLFLVEGVRLIEELLTSTYQIDSILYSTELSNKAQKLLSEIMQMPIEIEEVAASVFRSLTETETSQGLLAIVKLPTSSFEISVEDDLILVPDQIRDPGNLGTLLRSAVAAGVKKVIIPPDTADPYSPKVIRSGMGAHFKVGISQMSWNEIETQLTHHTKYLASADGDLVYWKADFRQPVALIIGGEAEGAGIEALKITNHKVNIPMEGKIESLNAGVAGSIILFEALRQRS